MRTEHDCRICGKIFNTWNELYVHVELTHKDMFGKLKVKSNSKKDI